MIYLIFAFTFLTSAVLTFILVIRSAISMISKILLIGVISAFVALTYILAKKSVISPFSVSNDIPFGSAGENMAILVGVAGAVIGVVGSYFFQLGEKNIRWRTLVPPLACCPLTLIPTIELIKAADAKSLISLMLLFALSYQTGFFWERIINAKESKKAK